MIKTIIKRNGLEEAFQPSKINKWGEWAAKTLGSRVDWSSVVLDTVSVLPEKCSSSDLQNRLIKTCLDYNTWLYHRMAGRLYAALTYKELYDGDLPTVKELQHQLADMGLMRRLKYNDDEYAEVEKIIDHKMDMKASYAELYQLRKKYSIQNKTLNIQYESPQFVYMRMAMALAEDQPESRRMTDVAKFYEHLSHKRINAPTPNYVNLGTNHYGLASCCLYTVADNLDSLAVGDHIAYKMTAMSAGIGSHLNTRSLGDPVRNGSIIHQGKLPYYRVIKAMVHANLQAGRGGAATVYYNGYDPEVNVITQLRSVRATEDKRIRGIDYNFGANKFLIRKAARDEKIFTFNSFTAPDLYKALYKGDQEEFETLYEKYENDPNFRKNYLDAREVVVGAFEQAYETGRAYLHWTDEMNRHTPHKDTIWESNLCVAPETQILTSDGYIPIAELENQNIDVWNGEEWSNVVVRKTGKDQSLLKVTTDCGYELECTPYHKFYVFNGYKKPYIEVRAKDLKPGDKLAKFDLPIIDGELTLDRAYENGFYSGDGCYHRNSQIIYLYHDKMLLKDQFTNISWNYQEDQQRMVGRTNSLKDKFFVPSDSYSIKCRLDWLAGYLDADGCVYRNGTNEALTASSTEKEFLREVQLMLQTLGVSSKVKPMYEGGNRLLPANDGTGEFKEFSCQDTYRLIITSNDSFKLLELGLDLKRLKIEKRLPQRDAKRFISVESVIDEGRADDTFCFNEPKRHMGMFNGILTGQCVEITEPTSPYFDMMDLYSYEDHGRGEIALCSLAAINVAAIDNDEQYEEVAYYSLLMIDKCIHIGDYTFPHLSVTAKARMNAGVGIIGHAYNMAKHKKKYSNQEGKDFTHQTAERHAYYCIKASLKLGQELGNAPWMHKTQWPDGWLPSDTYNQNVDQLVMVPNQYDWEELRSEIIANGGIRNSSLIAHMPSESSSVASGTTNGLYPIRDLTLMKTDMSKVTYWAAPEGEKLGRHYELAWDIPTSDMIDNYAIVQKWTDQSISADTWVRMGSGVKIDSSDFLTDYFRMTKFGMKTRYYQNSKTSDGTELTSDDDAACADGSCKL